MTFLPDWYLTATISQVMSGQPCLPRRESCSGGLGRTLSPQIFPLRTVYLQLPSRPPRPRGWEDPLLLLAAAFSSISLPQGRIPFLRPLGHRAA